MTKEKKIAIIAAAHLHFNQTGQILEGIDYEFSIEDILPAIEQILTHDRMTKDTAPIEVKTKLSHTAYPPLGKHKKDGEQPKRLGELPSAYLRWWLKPKQDWIKERHPEFYTYCEEHQDE